MDKLSRAIMSSSHGGADNGSLGVLARTASKRYVEDGVKLSDAVAELARRERLSPAQVQRVCEEANVTTFRSLFEKQSGARHVSFPLADYRQVLRETGHQKTAAVRPQAPAAIEASFVSGQDQVTDLAAELFGTPEDHFTKVAFVVDSENSPPPDQEGVEEPAPPTEEPSQGPPPMDQGPLIGLRERLKGVLDIQRSKQDMLDSLMRSSEADMLALGAQHVLEGGTLGEVLSALSTFATPGMAPPGPEMPPQEGSESLGQAVTKMAAHLIERGVSKRSLLEGMEKKSERVPNPNHPLIQCFQAWRSASFQHKVAATSIDMVCQQLDRVEKELGVG